MIENKKLGVKIAEDPEEAAWTQIKESIEKEISSMERALEMNKVLIDFIKGKLEEKKTLKD